MRALVLGTGAMGCLFAARLARCAQVTIAGTWAAGLDAIRRDGIVVDLGDARVAVEVEARALDEIGDERYELVLVVTKGWRTSSVAPSVAEVLSARGLVVTLQNGLGSRESLEEVCSRHRVCGGVTNVGALLVSPGVVRLAGEGQTILEGPVSKVGKVAALLTRAGFAVSVSDDFEAARWSKLAVNCAINPLAALTGATNGELARDAEYSRLLRAAASEVGAVAATAGVELSGDLGEHVLAVAHATAENRCSMLRDVEDGRQTEIEVLNGAVIRLARRVGIATPINEVLYERIRSLGEPNRPSHRQSA